MASPVVLTPVGAPSPAGSIAQRGQWTDLDLNKFYDDESDEAESDEGSEEESEEDLLDVQTQHFTPQTTSPSHPASDEGDDEGDEDEDEDEDEGEGEGDSEDEREEHDHSQSRPRFNEEW